jgi:hypothetical protein
MGIGHRIAAALTGAGGLAVLAALPALAATSYPNDAFFASGDQWALTGATASIDAPAAWCVATGAGETVAMVDTGVDFSNPDLQGKLKVGAAFTGGTATSENNPTGTDQASVNDSDPHNGHGTVTTGVIVADTNNGRGIAAVAPDATALVMNVRGSDGKIYESDVALAMEWAADHGANVINVSLGLEQLTAGVNAPDLTIPQAASYAAQRNVAVVLSAGNNGSGQPVYLNHSGALDVGALSPDGTMASYSNHGTDVDLFAPGGSTLDTTQMTLKNSIVSTFVTSSGYQYAVSGGTSLSAPMVSGTIALLMQAKHDSAAQAMSDVTSSAATRNGLKELDTAAALGNSTPCGSPSTPPPGGPPPVGKGGPTPPPGGTTQHPTTTTTTRVATTTRQTQIAQTTTSTTSTALTTISSSTVQTGSGDNAGKGGRGSTLPRASTPSPGGGGVPAPLVIGVLVLLIAGGAPLGVTAFKAWRGRGLMR